MLKNWTINNTPSASEAAEIERKLYEHRPAIAHGIDPSFPIHKQQVTKDAAAIRFQYANKRQDPTVNWPVDHISGWPQGMFISGGDSGSPKQFHTVDLNLVPAMKGGVLVGGYIKSAILMCPRCGGTIEIEATKDSPILANYEHAAQHPITGQWYPTVDLPPFGCPYSLAETTGVGQPGFNKCGFAGGVIKGKLKSAKRLRD